MFNAFFSSLAVVCLLPCTTLAAPQRRCITHASVAAAEIDYKISWRVLENSTCCFCTAQGQTFSGTVVIGDRKMCYPVILLDGGLSVDADGPQFLWRCCGSESFVMQTSASGPPNLLDGCVTDFGVSPGAFANTEIVIDGLAGYIRTRARSFAGVFHWWDQKQTIVDGNEVWVTEGSGISPGMELAFAATKIYLDTTCQPNPPFNDELWLEVRLDFDGGGGGVDCLLGETQLPAPGAQPRGAKTIQIRAKSNGPSGPVQQVALARTTSSTNTLLGKLNASGITVDANGVLSGSTTFLMPIISGNVEFAVDYFDGDGQGDTNADRQLDYLDESYLYSLRGLSTSDYQFDFRADLNFDNQINDSDLVIFRSLYGGRVCQNNPCDISDNAGNPLPTLSTNSGLNEGDYNCFFNGFFEGLSFADIADDQGEKLSGTTTNNGINEGDYNLFFNEFFNACT